jgi:hypothetical protein
VSTPGKRAADFIPAYNVEYDKDEPPLTLHEKLEEFLQGTYAVGAGVVCDGKAARTLED